MLKCKTMLTCKLETQMDNDAQNIVLQMQDKKV